MWSAVEWKFIGRARTAGNNLASACNVFNVSMNWSFLMFFLRSLSEPVIHIQCKLNWTREIGDPNSVRFSCGERACTVRQFASRLVIFKSVSRVEFRTLLCGHRPCAGRNVHSLNDENNFNSPHAVWCRFHTPQKQQTPHAQYMQSPNYNYNFFYCWTAIILLIFIHLSYISLYSAYCLCAWRAFVIPLAGRFKYTVEFWTSHFSLEKNHTCSAFVRRP